jgi:glyoxalase family protein
MPDTYHLYYGDEQGQPGTILTFFAWPDSPKGRKGTGEIGTISFSIPEQSMDYWVDRLSQHNAVIAGPNRHFGEQVLSIFTPDGLTLELVAHREADQFSGWKEGPVPAEYAIRGFHSVTVMESNLQATSVSQVESFSKLLLILPDSR